MRHSFALSMTCAYHCSYHIHHCIGASRLDMYVLAHKSTVIGARGKKFNGIIEAPLCHSEIWSCTGCDSLSTREKNVAPPMLFISFHFSLCNNMYSKLRHQGHFE